MTSVSFCVIAAIFIGASIYTMVTCSTCSPFVEYEKSLDSEQLRMYKQIVTERKNIYLGGLVLGSLLALLYLYTNGLELGAVGNSCIFVAIAMSTQYLFYMLYPKSNYMVTSMKNEEQLNKWLAVYKHMQNRYHVGMLLGLVGYFLFAFAIQK